MRASWLMVAIGCLGCEPLGAAAPSELEDVAEDGLSSDNGLSINGLSINGLSINGLSGNGLSGNGLASNGLSTNGLSINGLSTNGFSAWFHSGDNSPASHTYAAQLMRYIVRCACPSGTTRSYSDGATVYTWTGNLGVAPGWCNGTAISVAEQEWVSACLLAHANVLSDPLHPDPNLSVPISAQTGSPERNISVSFEEKHVMTFQMEEIYFGNLFDQSNTTSPKGLYAGMWADPTSNGLSVYRPVYDGGRRCWANGCPTAGAGIKWFGSGMFAQQDKFHALWRDLGYNTEARCRKDADCATINDGVTPLCNTAIRICQTKLTARCTQSTSPKLPLSCRDPMERSWARTIATFTSMAAEAEIKTGINTPTVLPPAVAVSGCGPACDRASAKGYVTGLSNGGAVEQYFTADGSVPFLSDGFRVRARYQGSGTLILKVSRKYNSVVPPTYSTVLGPTSYGAKALSCPSGQWCWAEWDGILLGVGDPPDQGYSLLSYAIHIAGPASGPAPDLDVVNLTASR